MTCKISFKNLELISDVDDVGSGTIGLEEFFKTMTHKILYRDPKGVVLKAFRLLDHDETGKISFLDLKLISDATSMAAAPLALHSSSRSRPTKS